MTPTRWKTDCWAVVDKPVVTQRITLRELQHAAISPKNNRPSRYETKFGTSFK